MELVHLWDSYISLKRYGRMQMEPNGNMKAMYIENPGDYERFWVFEVESPLARLAGKVYIAPSAGKDSGTCELVSAPTRMVAAVNNDYTLH